jgi:hypothetical protein
VQCPTCAYYNWFDVDAVGYKLTCGRCLKDFGFNQNPDRLAKYEWFYRVMGRFAVPDYARGGYAVALTLRSIARDHDAEITWSTGLDLKELDCEIDFAAWWRRGSMLDDEREEPVFVFGEAKSFGRDAVDVRSIERLRSVGERFPRAIIIVSTLKQISEYSHNELSQLRELARWGRARRIAGKPRNPLIVLTGKELFSSWGIRRAWATDGNPVFVRHANIGLNDLLQLAEATQQLYLGLPNFDADVFEFMRQRGRIIRALRSRSNDLDDQRRRIVRALRYRSKISRV